MPYQGERDRECRGDGAPPFSFESFIQERLDSGSADLYGETHAKLDQILLPAVLRATNGNQIQAAKVLGVARQTLRLRLRELGIVVAKTVREEDDAE